MTDTTDKKDSSIEEEEFWTFVTTKIELTATGMWIDGWFVYGKLSTSLEPGGDVQLETRSLSDPDNPLRLQIPLEFCRAISKRVDEISSKDIVRLLNQVFSLPFQGIPTPPSDLPMHKIPPTRRDQIKKALESRQTE